MTNTNQITLYGAAVPVFKQMLGVLLGLLDKAEAHIKQTGIDADVLLTARLYPDMYTFITQVQYSCDFVKGAMSRIADVDVPGYPDDEKTIEELRARIAKTLALIDTFKIEDINGQEDHKINMDIGNLQLSANAQDYLVGFVIPNLIFHVSTAYGILRHNGVNIGKLDLMGNVNGMPGLDGNSESPAS
ncbi:MAG: hypothetical protein COB36_12390 [Alphaproteobacteria bacterium]|nr:MAG: hypothetical protein COB36_12390 [Alphaproteobacteria bacterium]